MELENPLEAPNIIVLENQPIDPTGKYEYKAILQRSTFKGYEDQWVLKIVGIYPSGISLTPGQWYLDTLLGFDSHVSGGRIDDIIYIDYGQKWYVKGMTPVLKEAEEIIYGKMDESLNEGAVKDLILRGPGREPLIIWANAEVLFSTTNPSETIRLYCEENEMTPSELQALASIYMEDAEPGESDVLLDLISAIAEGKKEGELNEDEEPRYSSRPLPGNMDWGKHVDLRNWYQKTSIQPEKAKTVRKRKPGKRALGKIQDLEGQIEDLKWDLKSLRSDNRNRHNESEQYSSDIIEQYGWDFLDMLNSGLSKEEKIKAIEDWNMKQDEKSKDIKNPETILREHEYYYGEEDDKKEEELEKQLEQKDKELSELTNQFEYNRW